MYFLTKKLFASKKKTIYPCSNLMISLVQIPLLNDRNFLFYPTIQTNLTIYTHIINHKTSKIPVTNTFNCPLYIACYQKLGHNIDILYDNYFLVDIQAVFNLAAFLSATLSFLNFSTRSILAPTDIFIENQLNNGGRVYKNATIIDKYSS